MTPVARTLLELGDGLPVTVLDKVINFMFGLASMVFRKGRIGGLPRGGRQGGKALASQERIGCREEGVPDEAY